MVTKFIRIIFLLSFLLSNDSINFTVKNSNDNLLENVYVQLKKNDNTYISIGKTDETGNFVYDISDLSITDVKLTHIGYKDKLISIKNLSQNENIILEFNNIRSDQIVVTGSRSKTYIKDTPVLTYVITSDDIKKSAYSSVKEALEMSLPNVQNVMSSHAGISNEEVKIQGLDNKYLLFLIDGKRVSGEFMYFAK